MIRYKSLFENTKEEWEMTQKEYKSYRKNILDSYKTAHAKGITDYAGISDYSEYLRQKQYFKDWKDDHYEIVMIALKGGKPVPEEVLKEYPKLVKKYKK